MLVMNVTAIKLYSLNKQWKNKPSFGKLDQSGFKSFENDLINAVNQDRLLTPNQIRKLFQTYFPKIRIRESQENTYKCTMQSSYYLSRDSIVSEKAIPYEISIPLNPSESTYAPGVYQGMSIIHEARHAFNDGFYQGLTAPKNYHAFIDIDLDFGEFDDLPIVDNLINKAERAFHTIDNTVAKSFCDAMPKSDVKNGIAPNFANLNFVYIDKYKMGFYAYVKDVIERSLESIGELTNSERAFILDAIIRQAQEEADARKAEIEFMQNFISKPKVTGTDMAIEIYNGIINQCRIMKEESIQEN